MDRRQHLGMDQNIAVAYMYVNESIIEHQRFDV